MYNQALSDVSLIGCPYCDLLQRLPDIAPGESACCPRCNEELWHRHGHSLDRPLALTIAAALLYIVANAVPMLGLTAIGHEIYITVFDGAAYLWATGWEGVAVLVFFTAALAPGLQIGFMLAILIGAYREHPPRWLGTLMRYYSSVRTWSMIEVMILGVLVALIKIAESAHVIPGLALFVLGALVFLIAAIEASFDPREVWARVAWAATAAHNRGESGRISEEMP